MTTIIVRNDAEALEAVRRLSTLPARYPVKLEFRGWPRITVHSSAQLPGVQAARWITQLQTATERQYAVLKHGGTRRRLTAADRRDVKLDVHHHSDGQGLTVDFSRAANAAVRAVSGNADAPRWKRRGQKLFDFAKAAAETKSDAIKLGMAMIDKARPIDITVWGLTAILLTGLVFSKSAELSHQLDLSKESNRHQERMVALDHTTFAVRGVPATLPPEHRKALVADEARDRALALSLASDQLDHDPLLQFVVAEAERTRPAMLDLAPATGTLEINGAQIPAEAAHAMSKRLKSRGPAAKTIGAWTTTVRRNA